MIAYTMKQSKIYRDDNSVWLRRHSSNIILFQIESNDWFIKEKFHSNYDDYSQPEIPHFHFLFFYPSESSNLHLINIILFFFKYL